MKDEEQRKHDNVLAWCFFMFWIIFLIAFISFK